MRAREAPQDVALLHKDLSNWALYGKDPKEETTIHHDPVVQEPVAIIVETSMDDITCGTWSWSYKARADSNILIILVGTVAFGTITRGTIIVTLIVIVGIAGCSTNIAGSIVVSFTIVLSYTVLTIDLAWEWQDTVPAVYKKPPTAVSLATTMVSEVAHNRTLVTRASSSAVLTMTSGEKCPTALS